MAEKEKARELVRDWFTGSAEDEWRRLKKDPYHRLEFLVTMHFLEKHLPEEGLILDAGGGPGRYTIELAKRGYNLVLVDLVKKMLEIARRQIKKEGVNSRVKEIVESSVTDLSMFSDETFDGVLCLGGPLSHLLTIEERETAAKELVRVAKRNAPLFVSVIGRLGVLKTILLRIQEEMRYIAGIIWRLETTSPVSRVRDSPRPIGSCPRSYSSFLKNETWRHWIWRG